MPVITQFSVYTHCNNLGGKVWNPAIKWTEKHAVFVALKCDNATIGLGECWCFDSKPDALVAYLRTEIAPLVIGLNIDEHNSLFDKLLSRATLTARHGMLYSAWSGVDIALWDMRSRIASQPLWRFLASESNELHAVDGQVYLYGSGGLYGENKTTDDLILEMQEMHAQGFDLLKLKVGGLSIEEDLNRVQSVIKAIPENTRLIIDGVYSYTAAEALSVFNALPDDRIIAFQSPVSANDTTGMQMLTKAGVPVMGTEAEYREELHRTIIDNQCVKFLQTAPIACGGISRLRQLSSNIVNTPIAISLEVSSTCIALLAACHYAAADNRVTHTEYHFIHQVFFPALPLKPVVGRHGWFQLPDVPGMGIDLQMNEVNVEFMLDQH